jgi:hypothetical protein
VADNYHIDVTKDYVLEVPNAFTPNGDGLNDVLRIIANRGIEYIENFWIINREGVEVYSLIKDPKYVYYKNTNPGPDSEMLRVIDDQNAPPTLIDLNRSQMDVRGATGWNTWDGRDAQGRVLETDGYYWKAKFKVKSKSASIVKSGMFLLLK